MKQIIIKISDCDEAGNYKSQALINQELSVSCVRSVLKRQFEQYDDAIKRKIQQLLISGVSKDDALSHMENITVGELFTDLEKAWRSRK